MKRLRPLVIIAAIMVLLHFVAAHCVAGSDFMVALAAARQGQVGSSLLFALLLMVRLALFVMVPPLFVAGLGLIIYEQLARRRR
jgi:hypothetical protein